MCHCALPWAGPECQRLSLRDVLPGVGLDLRAAGTSTWGGSVVHGDDGRLYMYASEMVAHCGIDAWTRNSRVIVASADNISAPFRFEKELFGVFSHATFESHCVVCCYLVFLSCVLFHSCIALLSLPLLLLLLPTLHCPVYMLPKAW